MPFQLLSVCQQHSGALHPAGQPCVEALHVFLRTAMMAGITPDIYQPSSNTNSMSLSIGRQLERAGVLTLLPTLLAAAADQLAATQQGAVYIAEGLADPLYGGVRWEQSAAGRLTTLHGHVADLLQLLLLLEPCWPSDEFERRILPTLTVGISQLLLRLLQHVSLCLQQLRPGCEPPAPLTQLLLKVDLVADRCFIPAAYKLLWLDGDAPRTQQQRQQKQRLQQLAVESPYPVQAASLLLVLHAYSALLLYKQGAQDTAADSNSSIAGSSSDSSRREEPRSAAHNAPEPLDEAYSDSWQLASSSCDLLPPAHHKLLHALSCSSKAMLWAAAVMRSTEQGTSSSTEQADSMRYVWMLNRVYCGLIDMRGPLVQAQAKDPLQELCGALSNPTSWRQEVQTQRKLRWSESEQVVHLLLPSVLLLWAAMTPTGPSTSDDQSGLLDACCVAGICSYSAAKAWSQQERLRSRHVQDVSLQRMLGLSSLAATRSDEEAREAKDRFQRLSLGGPADLQLVTQQVKEALYLTAGFILPKLLQLCDAASSSSSRQRQSAAAKMTMQASRRRLLLTGSCSTSVKSAPLRWGWCSSGSP